MRPAAAGLLLAAALLAACRPAGDAGTAGGAAAARPADAARAEARDTAANGSVEERLSAEGSAGETPETATGGTVGERPGAADAASAVPLAVRRLVARVVASYPHDPGAYTQGLELAGGVLYESAGQYGESSVRRVDLETGDVLLRRDLPRDVFAEGLTLVPAAAGRRPRLVQLTWREGVALVWDPADLEPVGRHLYAGEGWGLCHDAGAAPRRAAGDGRDDTPSRLVMSDGSSYLTFRDPETFEVAGGVAVTLGGTAVGGLNELECVDGSAWANVYPTDEIVEIDLATGRVTATVDASGLLFPAPTPEGGVLNGIAHDPADGTFLLTGKYWPRLFRVELVER